MDHLGQIPGVHVQGPHLGSAAVFLPHVLLGFSFDFLDLGSAVRSPKAKQQLWALSNVSQACAAWNDQVQGPAFFSHESFGEAAGPGIGPPWNAALVHASEKKVGAGPTGAGPRIGAPKAALVALLWLGPGPRTVAASNAALVAEENNLGLATGDAEEKKKEFLHLKTAADL
jgi:hypothetical protein